MPLEPALAALDVGINIVNGAHVQTGKITGLRGGKQVFRGIQLRRVRGEPIRREPVPLAPHERFGFSCPVRRQPVPEEDHAPLHVAAELLEAADDVGVFDRVAEDAQEQLWPLPPGRAGDDADDGTRSPGTRRSNDRGTPRGRPRPPYARSLRNAGFVPEREGGAPADGFFLIRGQVAWRQ